ncbi:alpha/beta fold hydrolase [Massilia sp. PAMC28688]|uniref:alpha/beta fold hydrolase n=1 Tax=Massilia sp. PAMC28688 TaxID=2861283 RepID=UPI001C634EBF|nr:alpha/beta hydrolase [Massilia sp. PAMC28688]QYF92944.1 alpha/beta fold hydrolase [Massilia sp. PAMC28688]
MPYLMSNRIRIAYETAGDPKDVPLLLIMGLGMQMTGWPDALVEQLVDMGFYVVRFDNRDCGLSDKFEHAGTPSVPLALLKHLVRWPLKGAYSLHDMAADAMGVLKALGINKAHVVGASMGGMIAQIMAATHPERVASLTSIMSTSGRRALPGPTRAARAALLARPRGSDADSLIAHGVHVFRVIGSPAYPTSDKALRARIAASIRRNVCPGGVARQMLAIAASGERSGLLASIRVPTLVIHGAADPLVPLAAGIDTARLVPGARLEVIEGMGHDLPAQLIERIAALIDAHAHGKIGPDSTARLFERQ